MSRFTALATMTLTQRLLAALPQTQCTRCGYPDCAAYAQAMALEGAPINQCPPGGAEGIRRLASIIGHPASETPPQSPPLNVPLRQPPALALNPANGSEGPRAVAVIDENWCIGCTLCIEACPTDAILGSNKLMHTVIEPYCTGCALCLPVCPVDCIVMDTVTAGATGWAAWSATQADQARQRYEFRNTRLDVKSADKTAQNVAKLETTLADLPGHSRIQDPALLAQKRAVIEAALARARAKQAVGPIPGGNHPAG